MDWQLILVATILGVLSTVPISVIKGLKPIASVLTASRVPWVIKVAGSIVAAGETGTLATNFISGSEQTAFWVAATASGIAYAELVRRGWEAKIRAWAASLL